MSRSGDDGDGDGVLAMAAAGAGPTDARAGPRVAPPTTAQHG